MIKAAGNSQSLYKIGVEGRWKASGPGNKFAMFSAGMRAAAMAFDFANHFRRCQIYEKMVINFIATD
jgi:hypothetical protein